MRKSLLVSAALASGALLCSLGANAIPMHVGLLGASGSTTWTSPPLGGPAPSAVTNSALTNEDVFAPLSGTVSLSGWEHDDGAWSGATMIQNPQVPGLGVECNVGSPDCTGDQIGSHPAQIIDLDISQLNGWTGLLITLDSVEGTNTGNLYGATCAPGDVDCEAISFLGGCTTEGSCTLSLTSRELTGITDIWITPVNLDPIVLDGNLYVCSGAGPCVKPTAVPEPTALGMFGLGVLLIGVFVGLRRSLMN